MDKSTRNLLLLVGVVAVGVTAYYFYDKSKKKQGELKGGVTAESKQNTITLTGNTTITEPSNVITLVVTGWSADSDRYKAQISASFRLNTILSNGGRFSIKLVHHNNGTDYSFTQNDIEFLRLTF